MTAWLHSYTLDSPAGVRIFTQPACVGDDLAALSKASSVDFFRALAEGQFGPAPAVWDTTVVQILNGGRYYFLPAAVKDITGDTPEVIDVRAKRYEEPAGSGMWAVRTSEWPPEGAFSRRSGPLLIGDTVATGTTLAGVLDKICTATAAAPRDVIVFAIAGSKVALGALEPVAARLAAAGRRLVYVVANSQLGLAPNGTDLSIDEDATLPSAWEATVEALGDGFPVRSLKCAVWDWGDRFTQPASHLEELIEYYDTLPPSPFRDSVLEAARSHGKA